MHYRYSTYGFLFLISLMVGLLSGCDFELNSQTSTFYSYRKVGRCDNGENGVDYFPEMKNGECQAILTTKIFINISQANQMVTLIERDLGLNKKHEIIFDSAMRLSKCNIVDKNNFRCEGLERKDGKFVNTDLLSGRHIAESKIVALISEYLHNGWVEDLFI